MDENFVMSNQPCSLQISKCEDFLKLGEEDVREMLQDEEVISPAAVVI